LQTGSDSNIIHTPINADLQATVNTLIHESLQSWPAAVNAAVLVIRNSDNAVRAYVGGGDFLARENAGQFDHVRALRSPGSALKPMIYGLGFEALVIHPHTIVADRPVNFGGYAPQNFNEDYQGEMTVRDALINSINTTAVAVLARITPEVLLTRLRNAGLAVHVNTTDALAGLAVALGGGGMTLESLTQLYAGIANHGIVRPLKMLVADAKTEQRRLLAPDVAWALTDILAEVPPPPAFVPRRSGDGGRRIAYKTGTSFGYRDAWAIGFDWDHTVGVWVGRSDASPNPGAMGITTAAPLLYRIFDVLPSPGSDVAGTRPAASVLANRINIPSRLQRFANAPNQRDHRALRIVFPRSGSTVGAEKDGDGTLFVPLVADGGSAPYFWFVDGASVAESDLKIRWHPGGPGGVSATVMDSNGEMSSVEFWIR
jgi:penicillin-binding protein 1C